jgi:hypothetical protein
VFTLQTIQGGREIAPTFLKLHHLRAFPRNSDYDLRRLVVGLRQYEPRRTISKASSDDSQDVKNTQAIQLVSVLGTPRRSVEKHPLLLDRRPVAMISPVASRGANDTKNIPPGDPRWESPGHSVVGDGQVQHCLPTATPDGRGEDYVPPPRSAKARQIAQLVPSRRARTSYDRRQILTPQT